MGDIGRTNRGGDTGRVERGATFGETTRGDTGRTEEHEVERLVGH